MRANPGHVLIFIGGDIFLAAKQRVNRRHGEPAKEYMPTINQDSLQTIIAIKTGIGQEWAANHQERPKGNGKTAADPLGAGVIDNPQ